MILVKKRNRSKKKFLRLFLIFENNAWNNNVFTPAVLNWGTSQSEQEPEPAKQFDYIVWKEKSQTATFKNPPPSCPPEKLIEHFTNHFNPPLLRADAPIELTTDIPEFVKDLQELSRQYPFNNDASSRDEVINSLAKLSWKALNDISTWNPKTC